MRPILLIISLCIATLVGAQNIVKEQSSISFSIQNMGAELKGTFKTFDAEISFDQNNISQSKFVVRIPVKTINTGNGMRDEHLQEAEFFNASDYPLITFSSDQITKSENGYKATGTISIKGIEKKIEIPFKYSENNIVGSFTINRNDYNIGGSDYSGTIGDIITINVSCKLQ